MTIIESLTWQTGVPLYASRAVLVSALLDTGCVFPSPRELALYALAARIRRAFGVCR